MAATDDKKIIETLVKSHAPAAVQSYTVRIEDDSSGEPSLRVRLKVPRNIESNPKRFKEVRTFIVETEQSALRQGVKLWPYFQLVTGK